MRFGFITKSIHCAHFNKRRGNSGAAASESVKFALCAVAVWLFRSVFPLPVIEDLFAHKHCNQGQFAK